MDKNGYETESIFEGPEGEQERIFELNSEEESSHQKPLQPSAKTENTSTGFNYIVLNALTRQLDIVRRQTEAFKSLTATLKELLLKLESQNNFNKRISELEAEIERMKKVQEMHGREIGHMCLEWFKGGIKPWWRRFFRI